MNGAVAAGFLCAILVGILLGLIIGSVILRAACWMCGVKEPGTWQAMGIVLLTGIANAVIGLVLGVLAASSHMDKVQTQVLSLVVNLGTLPINMLVSAGIYTATLKDVTFGKGILIWLAQLLIGILIAVAVVGVLLLVYLIAWSAGGLR